MYNYFNARYFIHNSTVAGGEGVEEERAQESASEESERADGSDDEEQDAGGAFSEIQEQNFNIEDFISRYLPCLMF